MFESENQRARVCKALLTHVGIDNPAAPRLWNEDGPTELAMDLLDADGGGFSSGERIMFLVAWQIWNGDGKVKIEDVAYRLDQRNTAAVGSLLVAMSGGPGDVDRWLHTMANLSQLRTLRAADGA